MLRILDITLVLAVIASSALASAPCFCADMAAHVQVAEAPADEDDGCCPGSDEEQAPATPEHDCPHCATAQCDVLASVDPHDVPTVATLSASTVPPFTVAYVWGEQRAPVVIDAAPLEPRRVAPTDPPPAERQDTYALNRVIRC